LAGFLHKLAGVSPQLADFSKFEIARM